MIYLLHGTDIDKARGKALDLTASLQKKKPDASFFRMDAEHWDEAVFDESIAGQGLFENKRIIFLDRLCEDKSVKEILLSKIKEIGESQNIFIVLEGKLDKASLAKFEKNSEKVQEFLAPEKKKEFYNAFALADAFARKDKKTAWMLYRQAIDKGEAPEALHGMLFWKVKTMIMNASYGAYSRDELHALAEKLITIYHEARRGKGEMETGVEGVVLRV